MPTQITVLFSSWQNMHRLLALTEQMSKTESVGRTLALMKHRNGRKSLPV